MRISERLEYTMEKYDENNHEDFDNDDPEGASEPDMSDDE